MRESQYIDDYIDSGYTIGSFLTMKLKGSAKDYKSRYQLALEHAVERRVAAGTAFAGRSLKGGIAYYSKPQEGKK